MKRTKFSIILDNDWCRKGDILDTSFDQKVVIKGLTLKTRIKVFFKKILPKKWTKNWDPSFVYRVTYLNK